MGDNDKTDFMNKINELTNQFYSGNKKNLFFKNNQKQECATTIAQSIGFEDLIQKTAFIIHGTNGVFLDYAVFKLYAVPEYYEKIVHHILYLFDICIQNYGCFNAHINLNTFTLSAAERYKNIINVFINTCMTTNGGYSLKLNTMFIYNTPNTFSNISNLLMPLIDKSVKQKLVLFDKNKSAGLLKELFYIKN